MKKKRCSVWDIRTLRLAVSLSPPPVIVQSLVISCNVPKEGREGCKEGVGYSLVEVQLNCKGTEILNDVGMESGAQNRSK